MRDDFLLAMRYRCDPKQRGAATLVVAVVLLVIVLGISFFTAEVVITEKKITADEYRAKQAFHAAQAGLDFGMVYARVDLDQDGDGNLDLTTATGGSVGESSYLLSFTDVSSGADMALIELKSEGFSDDGLIQRTVSALIGKVPLVPNPPDLPLVARGEVKVSGNLNAYNVFTNLNVWSGEAVDAQGSPDTYVRDPDWTDGIDGSGDPNWDGTQDLHDYLGDRPLSDVPTILSTSMTTRGPDVIEGDVNLSSSSANEFISNFFGSPLDVLAADASYTGTSAELAAEGPAVNGKIIHLTDGKIKDDFGTPSSPVIIVTKEPLSLTGGTIYGLVVAREIKTFAGNTEIFGGLVSEGDIPKANGTVDVYFDGRITEELKNTYTMEKVRGSWKDWGN